MSTIAIWINSEESKSIWAVSDTRYSSPDNHNLVTDYGPKIYEMQIICKKPDTTGFMNQIYWQQKIGIAFAGKAIIALCIITNINKILSSLVSTEDAIPSIIDIHKLVERIACQYTTPIINNNPIEFSTFGYCYLEKKFKIFTTQIPRRGNSVSEDNSEFCENEVLLLGSHKAEIREKIVAYKALNEMHSINRIPLIIIKDIIKKSEYLDIGGGIQLGITLGINFELFSIAEPIGDGSAKATLKYTNIDMFSEIKTVGNCFVSIHGMA